MRQIIIRMMARAGVLVLSTPSTRVIHFCYISRTCEIQSNSTPIYTRIWSSTRVFVRILPQHWYPIIQMQYKGKNHHTYAINSLTFHKKKFWIDCFFIRSMITMYSIWNAIANSTIFLDLYNWMNQTFIFIAVIHTSPFSHWTIGPHFKTNSLSRHGNFHYKHKTVVRESYLYSGNSYTGKTASLYWNVHRSRYENFYLNNTIFHMSRSIAHLLHFIVELVPQVVTVYQRVTILQLEWLCTKLCRILKRTMSG